MDTLPSWKYTTLRNALHQQQYPATEALQPGVSNLLAHTTETLQRFYQTLTLVAKHIAPTLSIWVPFNMGESKQPGDPLLVKEANLP